RGGTDALGDGDVDVLQHREAAEQPVDLERPRDAELDPLGLGHPRDVTPLQQDRAGGWSNDAGQEVDERRLAGAVWADEGVARAGLEPKVDVARGGQRAEVAVERAGLEQRRRAHDAARCAGRRSAAAIPRMPLRANRAMTTSRSPSPSCQAVG